VSCELNRLIQSPEQDQLVCEGPIMLEQVSQLESDMFNDMESALNHLDDQQTSQDDQLRLQDDDKSDQNSHMYQQIDQQPSSLEVNSQDYIQDQHNGQIDQSSQNEVIPNHQENGQDDQGYEVQAVNITFESSDSDDDHVTVEYEEGGVVTSTSWILHTPDV